MASPRGRMVVEGPTNTTAHTSALKPCLPLTGCKHAGSIHKSRLYWDAGLTQGWSGC